ncbi:hypothetical protein ACFV9C_35355 [Kribbella sp. NPDC059898]|uniref:hypothetical protein n=1 Tax=Kribbella sp. NPDC059898 TaxID=3346995 RepID=UPI0036549E9A
MGFSVVRTRDEAHLYLELHSCPDCGTDEAPWQQALVDVDGELSISYSAVCPGCGAEREYLFGVPDRETPVRGWPTFGGPEPSDVIDAGQWLEVAERLVAAVPTDRTEAGRALAIARAAVAEVIKFVPEGLDAVPDEEFWTVEGRANRETDPGRFRLQRLLLTRDRYAELAEQLGAR